MADFLEVIMDREVIQWLQDLDNIDISIRQGARQDLIAYKGDICELMITLMNEQQGRRSWEAAVILSKRREERAVEAMKQNLSSRHPVLGQIAAEFLSTYGSQHLEAMIAALSSSTYLTQIAIINILERIGDYRAIEPLLALLHRDPQGVTLSTIIRALGNLGDARAAVRIRPFLDHPDPHVSKHARLAIQRLEALQNH